MNEMMNRNYNCDVDEDELDNEMKELGKKWLKIFRRWSLYGHS